MQFKKTILIFLCSSFSVSLMAQSNFDLQILKAISLIGRNDFKSADSVLAIVLKEYPEKAMGHFQYGYSLYSQNRLIDAKVAFKRTLELDSTMVLVYKYRGMIFHRENDILGAEKDYIKYIKRVSKDSLIITKLADCYFSLGKNDELKLLLKDFRTNNRDYALAYVLLAMVFEQEEDYDKAIDFCNLTEDLNPTVVIPFEIKSRIYYNQGNLEACCAELLRGEHKGFYELHNNFRILECHKVLRIGEEDSPYDYPPPPPEEIIED